MGETLLVPMAFATQGFAQEDLEKLPSDWAGPKWLIAQIRLI
jgi:hypothetical protein